MNDELRKAAQDALDTWDYRKKLGMEDVAEEMEALRAALQSCPDCGKPTPPDSVHTCSPQAVVAPFVDIIPRDEGYSVRLKIGVQSFDVGPVYDERDDAWWLSGQLRGALKKIGSQPDPMQTIHVFGREQEALEDAKQRLLEIMRRNSLATGHGDTIDDALKELDWQLSELKGKSDGTL